MPFLKIRNGLSPSNLSEHFVSRGTVHSYNTRFSKKRAVFLFLKLVRLVLKPLPMQGVCCEINYQHVLKDVLILVLFKYQVKSYLSDNNV